MASKAPDYCIILAAGKGTRMRSSSLHKVCFPIDGTPAINRAISVYNESGVSQHVVVVGSMAGQVVETVGSTFENVTFAFQAEQMGTAHAVKVGVHSLRSLGDDVDILLVAGDRIIDLAVLERLYDVYHTNQCDLALLACPRIDGSSQGRIVTDGGDDLLAITEVADIRQREALRIIRALAENGEKTNRDQLIEILESTMSGGGKSVGESKLTKAFPELWPALKKGGSALKADELLSMIPPEATRFEYVGKDGIRLHRSPEEVLNSPHLNTSVYLVRSGALFAALERLERNNAQQEEYLSDIVAILNAARKRGGRRRVMKMLEVRDPRDVLGFNDPAELLAVENHVQSKKRKQGGLSIRKAEWYRPISEWRTLFKTIAKGGKDAKSRRLRKEMSLLYGDDDKVVKEHVNNYVTVLDHAAKVIGPRKSAFIVRSPGRVNVMGRHVDHQGGNCNLMTIGFETLMVARPRDDDRVVLHNVDRQTFGDREFSIGELVVDLPWDDWLSLVNSHKVSKMIKEYGVDWSRYIQSAVLRLQKKFPHTKLSGMDLVVWGNVPMAAGLSSSSSLVVGAAEAVVAANRLNTFPSQLVDLCGEGEWFVGTRGGSADHAAVKLGQKGKVIKVTFFDFAIQDVVSFPENYVMAVCDSGIKARKSANAKDQFNHRISCYRLGFKMIKRLFPQFRSTLHHLRDVNTRNLGVPLSWIYRIALHLPEQATRDEIKEILQGENVDEFFETHEPPEDGLYPIRGVVLFGLAEFERSRLYADYLKDGRVDEIGRLMNVSHNGDRVAALDANGAQIPYHAPTSNIYLLNLIEDLESGQLDRVATAQLQWQPGSYHCSVPAIDKMIDISLRTPGVAGAQLAGAGLGGCMMVLAHLDAVVDLAKRLKRDYYTPLKIDPNILVCKPVAGAGVLLKDS